MLLCPWNSPGKNTGLGSHSLLQVIFLTQGSNTSILHCKHILYHLSRERSQRVEHQRMYAFELWCWRRLLRIPWTARRSNQSILKEINPKYSLEELMLKLQSLSHLMQTADSLEKTLMLGKVRGKRSKGQQRMRWLDSLIDSRDMNLSKLCNIVEDRGDLHAAAHGVAKCWTQLSN